VTGIVGDLANCKILVIGAGEAGRLVAKTARDRGASQMVVASRSEESASSLAQALGASWVTISNLREELRASDIVISCTGTPHLILKRHQVEMAMSTRPERPLVIVDIAVPRDVEIGVKQINSVFLYNIDDLTETSTLNRKQRECEIQRATKIIEVEVDKFTTWWQALEVRPVVSALMNKAEDIRQGQLDLTLKKLRKLSDEERESLEAMTKAIVTKMLSDPIQYLKKTGYGRKDYTQIVNELFQLNVEKPE
jgi:glutamyl-tRNA reductase